MIIVDVFVPGAAKTKGSMEVRNRATGAMKESVAGSPRWRALMAQAVRDDIERRGRTAHPQMLGPPAPYEGAVSVTVEAYLTPPGDPRGVDPHLPVERLSAKVTAMLADALRWVWPIWHRAGDLDKLVRNVLDALGSTSKNPKMNGGAIVDDNLVCRIMASKVVAGERTALGDPRHAGVRIVVETL